MSDRWRGHAWVATGLLGSVVTIPGWHANPPATPAASANAPGPAVRDNQSHDQRPFLFEYESILGTSLDLTLAASSRADAARAADAVLAEIERQRGVLSGWETSSQFGSLVSSGRLAHPSPDLTNVLQAYDQWNARSGGAFSARVGSLVALWRAAEAEGRLPDPATLEKTAADTARPAWRIGASGVRMLTTQRIDLNSLGKGYVIDRAIAAARRTVPTLRGGIVNLGGDVRTWGIAAGTDPGWRVAVADPRVAADNAAPLTTLHLGEHAVSSSGRYARGYTIAGRRYSHIIDPRTGIPADAVAGTTVIAPNSATANALATTLSVLAPGDGLALASEFPGVEALIVGADGSEHRSSGFAIFEEPHGAAQSARTVRATLRINVTPETPNRHRPYVAVWVTDTAAKHIRTLAFWANKPKYYPELSKWYGMTRSIPPLVDAVTRATRAAGEYTLEWDGLDEEGKAVASGPYLFWLETALEHGPHAVRSVQVLCAPAAGTARFEATAAFAGGTVTCTESK